MKRTISLLCILVSFFLSVSAQTTQEIEREKIKGKINTYRVTELSSGTMHTLRYINIKDSLRWINYRWPDHRFSLPKLGNQNKLDLLTKTYILPFLKKNNLIELPVNSGIGLGLVGDNSGIVSEVSISIPIEWKFPIEIIENYMEAIKKEKLKFDFHVSPEFLKKEVPMYGRYYEYTPSLLKEMLQEMNP